MSSKTLIWIGMFVGSAIGGYVPSLWGAGFLTFSSAIFTAVGGFFGIWIAFRLSNVNLSTIFKITVLLNKPIMHIA